MAAEQLLEMGQRYTDLSSVPSASKPTIKSLKKAGVLAKDKEAEANKEKRLAAKQARRTRVALTDEQWAERALATKARNDKSWKPPAEEIAAKDLQRLAAYPFWDRLLVKNGFKDVMSKVLPHLWDEDKMRPLSKTALLEHISGHLALVDSIANKEVPNTITKDNVDQLGKEEIVALFVKADQTKVLSEAREAGKKLKAVIVPIIKANGTEVRYKTSGMKEQEDMDVEEASPHAEGEGGEGGGEDVQPPVVVVRHSTRRNFGRRANLLADEQAAGEGC